MAIPEGDSLADDKPITTTQENVTDRDTVIPAEIIESVALLAREMEDLRGGIPQDLEWTHDGDFACGYFRYVRLPPCSRSGRAELQQR